MRNNSDMWSRALQLIGASGRERARWVPSHRTKQEMEGAITLKDWEHNSKADELATEVLDGMAIDPSWEDLDFRRKAAQDRLKEAVAVLRSARRQNIDLAGDWEQGRRHRRGQGGPTSRAPNR